MEVRGAADGRWLMVEGSSSMGQKKYRVPYNWPESNVDVGHSWQLESPPQFKKAKILVWPVGPRSHEAKVQN